MAASTPESPPLRRLAHTVMFWLGVGYVLVLLGSMTPFTYQLDDIKVVVIHVLGPLLIVVYLAFLALGLVDPPRRGILLTLGAYFAAITVSTLLSSKPQSWIAREGFQMQWVLLGPFLAFLTCGGDKRRIHHAVMFLALIALLTAGFGLAHRGIFGRPGPMQLAYGVRTERVDALMKSGKSIYAQAQRTEDPRIREALRTRGKALEGEINAERSSYSFKILATLCSPKALREMMSLILNRNFLASFLLLVTPFVIASLATTRHIPWRLFGGGAGVLCAIALFQEFRAGWVTAAVPRFVLQGALLISLIPLGLHSLWRVWNESVAKPLVVLGGVALLLLGAVVGIASGWSAFFLACFLPLGAGAYLYSVSPRQARIAAAVLLAGALVCLLAGKHAAMYLLLLAPLVTAGLIRAPRPAWSLACIVTTVMSVLCMYYTSSKACMYLVLEVEVLLLVALLILSARLGKRRTWRVAVVALAGSCLLAGLLAVSPVGGEVVDKLRPDSFQPKFRSFANAINTRLIIWEGGMEIWQENPLFGAGLNTFRVLFPLHRRPDYNLYEINHVTIFAHNLFVDLLAESGAVGFATFLIFLGFIFWKVFLRILRAPDWQTRVIASCLLTSMASFLLSNVPSPNARWPICAGNMWVVLGLMAAMINRPLAGPTSFWRPTPKQKAFVWILCGISVLGWAQTSRYSYNFFLGSMNNNQGLAYIGQPPRDPGPVGRAKQRMRDIERDLKEKDLSREQRQMAKKELERTKARYDMLRNTAIGYFEEAVRYNPHFITSYYKLASLQSQGDSSGSTKKDLKKALATYDVLRSYAPEFSQVRFNLGMMYMGLGDSEKAIEHLRVSAASTVHLRESEFLSEGLLRLAEKRPDWLFTPEDIVDSDGLVRELRKPRHLLSHDIVEGLSPDSRDIIKNTKETDDLPPAVRKEIVAALNAVLKSADPFSPDPEQDVSGGDDVVAVTLPEFLDRTEWTSRTQWRTDHVSGDEERLRLNRSLICEAYDGLLQRHPGDEALQALWRVLETWTKIYDEKKPVTTRRDEQEGILRRCAARYAKAALQLGQKAEALFVLRGLWRIAPENESLIADIAHIYEQQGDTTGLLTYLAELLAEQPQDRMARFWLAKVLLDAGDAAKAKRQKNTLKKLNPRLDDVYYLEFRIAQAENDPERAAAKGREFLKTSRNKTWRQEVEAFLNAGLPTKGKSQKTN